MEKLEIKMKNSTKLLYGLGFATVLGATTAFATVSSVDHRTADTPEASIPEASNGMWRLEATGVRIIGGYGHNFAYNGENVRWHRLPPVVRNGVHRQLRSRAPDAIRL